MPKYLKSMEVSHIPQLHLEDKQMPHSLVKRDQNIFEYTSSGENRYISAARTSQPLIANMAAVYFEAQILKAGDNTQISIGLMHKDCDLNKHPGKNNRSIGYISNGDLYVCKEKIKSFLKYREGDVVGMGLIFETKEVFITLNGDLLGRKIISQEKFQPKYCPCISLQNKGEKVQLSFNNFKFNFDSFLKQAELQCQKSIEKQAVMKQDHFKIIAEYLKFYGYRNTLQKLQEKQVSQQKVNCYKEHPFFKKRVKVKGDIELSQGHKTDKVQSEQKMQSDLDKQLQKCSLPLRNRIMSEYLGEVVPVEVTRKRTYDLERELFESKRKSSIVENEDIQPSHEQSAKKYELSKVIYNKQTTDFLNNERITILELLRHHKIDQAQRLLEEKLPKIFEIHSFLAAYFLIHTYLKTLKFEGVQNAIKYVKTSNQEFKKCKKEQFPVYLQKGKREKKDFAYFMALITKKDHQNEPAFSQTQFDGFANHVNQLILQSLGLYYQSRLDLLLNHIRTIGNKAEQYQIPGQFKINEI